MPLRIDEIGNQCEGVTLAKLMRRICNSKGQKYYFKVEQEIQEK